MINAAIFDLDGTLLDSKIISLLKIYCSVIDTKKLSETICEEFL